jgi:hypothetical protein
MVRTGRIAGRRADNIIFLADQLRVREMLVGIGPEPVANLGVEDFGETLGEPVRQRL